ncbi:MAG: ATP-binding cassette domain-containing protein [Planctomycetales bacterium]|nr:ATP-binding cassette domain-containing protein [Planctomycetales bacterium]NIM09400.1 ATP-binding cassette domain-containing protein [Planctomycetales bacterium]NIN08874.1 ATP-binding cassette domain-containing protein [Planctomycetales bacterium]NIN77989.1 ATP-binding cassette domain-containing protein [Planctomycetales bacterium]NIO35172.1 ATP-binding cassette domain-containing protein [Planctomycetales bacterium]
MFELVEISKRYGDRQALHPTSLRLASGTTYAIVGPSGCGKSTLLRLMIGLISPDSGHILFENKPLSEHNVQVLRHQIGLVIQEGGLFPHLTARANVTLMAGYLGWPADRIERRVRQVAELTQFPQDGLERYPAQLSGGQRQRTSLMRALMLDPDLLLLDEPLGALDPLTRFQLQTELRDIFRQLQKTVVLVTHDMGEAAYLGDSLILLREGRMVQQGTIDELLDRPADPFVSSFLHAHRSPLEEREA